jgi:phosphopantetheinyl transferase
MTDVLVLHSTLPAGPCPAGLSSLLARLPYAKRLEIEGRSAEARCASLAGIALALRGMANMLHRPVDPCRLSFPSGGKPSLPGGPSFSVSHGASRVGVALCSDCELGFDLEQLGIRSGEPAAGMPALVRWIATEALLKAAGRGLRDANDVTLAETLVAGRVGDAWFHLAPVDIAHDVVAYLATARPAGHVQVEEVEASALVF